MRTLNKLTKRMYRWAYLTDREIEIGIEQFWEWVFPTKAQAQKPQPRIMSTAYPDGRVVTYNIQK